MNRTPLPPRTTPMSRGSGFRSPSSPGTATITPSAQRTAGKAPRETGFPPAVRLAVRTRAGDGDPAQARCECHGIFLGLHGGEIQHIIARGMGGTSSAVINFVVNAALMCSPGHRLAETRDREMYERGFWRHSWEAPGAAPLVLGTPDGGFTRWLTTDGGYSATAPGEAA